MGIKVKLVKSISGASERQRGAVAGLGLRKFGQERLLRDTPAVRGMVFQVKHLVKSEVVSQEPEPRKRMQPRKIRMRNQARSAAK